VHIRRLAGAFGCVAVAAGAILTGAGSAEAIVGGEPASQPYPFEGSLQLTDHGDPNWHTCGVTLIAPQWVETNAHCVTNEAEASTSQTATAQARYGSWLAANTTEGIDRNDPATFHVRIGSADRLSGGVVRRFTRIVVDPSWAWGVPDSQGRIGDIALMRLDRPVNLPPAIVLPARAGLVRDIGWGMNADPATWEGPAPRDLAQIDVPIKPAQQCAASGIGAGELCLGGIKGGDCFGDSGSAALQPLGRYWGIAVGSSGRGQDDTCGQPGKPDVYTDLGFYRDWMIRVVYGLPQSASTAGLDLAASA
jgi:hypothetical protein